MSEFEWIVAQGLSSFPSVRIVGIADAQKRAPVVSVDFIGYDNAQIAYLLDSEHRLDPMRAALRT